jgi:hypothetical protein
MYLREPAQDATVTSTFYFPSRIPTPPPEGTVVDVAMERTRSEKDEDENPSTITPSDSSTKVDGSV